MADERRSEIPVSPGDVVGGKYRVERVLGAGGMGVVVAAVHLELGQSVALKFILPSAISGKDAVERFMREARAVARLKSEHVARVFDVGRDEQGNPYMVLELLEGEDLATLAKRNRTLAIGDAVEYVLQPCEALVEAHAAGIVHRDLKPQNLFVTHRLNGAPLVKVLDFGIAKAVGAAAAGQMQLTDSQAVIGSPLYMAPEHMRSARAADIRSDIWSLGVILYELLSGHLPFDGDTVTEVCIRVVNEQPTPLMTLRPGLDPKLVDVTMRCLEKDPARRWQNVAQLAGALEPFARSTQLGNAPRPWRSLEDTVAASAAPAAPSPGMGTATISAPPGPAPATSSPPAARSGEQEGKLVSTGVSWGAGARPRRSRFTAGLGVGALLALAAVAGAAVVLRTRSPAIAVAPLPAASSISPAVASAPASEPTEKPSTVAPVEEAGAPGAAIASAAARPRSTAARPPRPQPGAAGKGSASPPSPDPVAPADTPGPNGAPILR
jgi:serine/threonine-protein kinase